MEISLQLQHKQMLSMKQQQSVAILQMNTLALLEYARELAEENPLVEWKEEPEIPKQEKLLQKLEWLEEADEQNRSFYQVEHESDESDAEHFGGRESQTLREYLLFQINTREIPEGHKAVLRFLAESTAESGWLEVPEAYKETVKRSLANKNSEKWTRIPAFIEALNQMAGYTVCDNEKIFINDPQAPTGFESAAILATHTGNTSVYSFAAEVEYHARFLTPLAKIKIPFFGRSIYDSAIRADMTVSDSEFEGPAPFYRSDSDIVKRQRELHRDKAFVRR